MNHVKPGLIAAMPEEINPLLKRIGIYRKEKIKSFTVYRFSLAESDACLIASGMGPANGAAAVQTLIEVAEPSIIINFGFAGAVTKGPAVGDLVVAEHLLHYHDALFSIQEGLAQTAMETSAQLQTSAKGRFHVYRSTFITAAQIIEKQGLIGLLPKSCNYPVLDMETAAVAKVATEAGIPLMAVRAISDAADEELGFSLDAFTDEKMQLRMGKILGTIMRKPWIIPQLLRLAKNTKIAGANLALGMESIIRTI
jgi:adenosylhomocysteine nucleosidase